MHIDLCPFCGSVSTAVLEVDTAQWAVVCHGCEATGPVAPLQRDAIKAWSHRGQNADLEPLESLYGKVR
jgi:Lar family restriction alleviation protein